MAFYENTIVAKQDLATNDVKEIVNKYEKIINSSSGKVLKIEEWGLLNLANKIKKYNKENANSDASNRRWFPEVEDIANIASRARAKKRYIS